MAKYFLGSVGKAEAFRKKSDGTMELAFVSKTLTDSGLNISTTKDDIRAGQGAPIQFSFYHDPSVEITLTDVLWKKEYLTAQLGANWNPDSEDYVTEIVHFVNSEGSLKAQMKKMPFPCGETYMAWAAKKGSEEWETVSTEDGKALRLDGAEGDYCVRYLGTVTNAKKAEILSTIIPEELYLIITAPIFAGDACAASRGKAAGHITFDVPRFVLNGSQEFSMNMSSNQTMSLAGTALAAESSDCDANGGKLLSIREVIDAEDWTNDIDSIVVDEEFAVAGQTPEIYGVLKDGSVVKIPNDSEKVTFAPALVDNKWAAGKYTITVGKVSEEVTIA